MSKLLSLLVIFSLQSTFAKDEVKIALSNYKPFVSKDADTYGLHTAIVLKVLKKMKHSPKVTFYKSWGQVYKKLRQERNFYLRMKTFIHPRLYRPLFLLETCI